MNILFEMKESNFLGVILDESLNWKSEIYEHLDWIFKKILHMFRQWNDQNLIQKFFKYRLLKSLSMFNSVRLVNPFNKTPQENYFEKLSRSR